MKQAYWISLSAAFGLFVTAVGCGIGGADSLFDSSGGTPGGTSSGGEGGASTSSGEGGSSSQSGTGASSSSSSSNGAGGMGGVGGAGGGGPASSSSSSTGVGGSGPTNVIPCGDNLSCPYGGDNACCWNNYQTGSPPYNTCVNASPSNDDCNTGTFGDSPRETRIECADNAQCGAGNVCCAHRAQSTQNAYYDQVTCESSCSFYNGHRTLCDLSAPNTCPTVNTQQGPLQLVCKQSTLLPTGYGICTNP